MQYKDFEKALERLEKIVAELEKGEVALEEGMKLFEEGVQLSRFCSGKLEDAEQKVEVLMRDGRGKIHEVPYEGEAGD